MTTQCRTCGEWFKEKDMLDTDYRTYVQQGEPDEMVCEGCYDNYYGRCSECRAIREMEDLVKNDTGEWICNLEQIDHQDSR